MPVFQYEAIDQSGKITNGKYTAEMINEVEQWLTKKGLVPINIHTISGPDSSEEEEKPLSFWDKLRGVNLDDLILFCRQIATMLSAGVPILQSLDIMAKQLSNIYLRRIVADVAVDIESGTNLSEAFGRHPKVFNQLFRNVILIGEESGNLDKSFNYLASLYENEKDVKERIKTATRYPKIVVGAMFSAVFFLMTFVVPKFITLFANSKVALPLPTRILIIVSNIFTNHSISIIAVIILAVTVYRTMLNYPEIILIRDKLLLKTPVFGNLAMKIYMSRFCRVFSVLTESGIDIIKTLKLSASALNNMVLYNALAEITAEVEEGVNLQGAMSGQHLFPEMVVQMVAVGEESGQLDSMMARVADYFEVETDYAIRNLATMIEPFLLLVLGCMVAFIALAIFMPMWNIMSVMRG